MSKLSPARLAALRKARKAYAYKKRMDAFGAIFAQLKGRQITREDLLACFLTVYTKGYNAGWNAGQPRRLKQQAAQTRTAA